jgi:tight adherence protein C
MTVVVLLALGVGTGIIGVVLGIRRKRPSLEAVLAGLSVDTNLAGKRMQWTWKVDRWRLDHQVASRVASAIRDRGMFERELDTRLALVNSTLEELAGRSLVYAVAAFLLPVLLWIIVTTGGLHVPIVLALACGVLLSLGGALVPVAELYSEAKRALRHARRVICSFLDLVVLGLAGGMGIESALFAAAQLGENVMSRRISSALSRCRDSGEPPWEALARLGTALGIEELAELSATVGLAGMEGAKVRASLAARAASIRRHELANAEAEANALTEKLFVPGAFLLVGFLIFIGYPAFTRIASGF